MKTVWTIALIMASLYSTAQNGVASTSKKVFSRTTTISQVINATPEDVWALLTDADSQAEWNTTIVSLSGEIAPKGKIELVSKLDTSRTFKLKVKEFVPNEKLVWGDAMGARTYQLVSKNGQTHFTMTEKIGGLMFPLFAGKIPSFDESFETFTHDLKEAAESKD